MPNFHPILFQFCAYVNNMFMYNMHRDRKFSMKTNNLAALFLGLFESPSYYGPFSNQIHAHVFLKLSMIQYKKAIKMFVIEAVIISL